MSDQVHQVLPDSVWDDPDYQQRLEEMAEEEERMNSYENGHGRG